MLKVHGSRRARYTGLFCKHTCQLTGCDAPWTLRQGYFCTVLSYLVHQGMAMVELLRQLERRANAPIWTLFDVIGGTSTGGLLAVSLGLLRLDLDACQEIYTSLGNKVRSRVGWMHAWLLTLQ